MDIRDKIIVACNHSGITRRELASRIGMSEQSLSQKMKRGSFTTRELEGIAAALKDCNYIYNFEFKDGTTI